MSACGSLHWVRSVELVLFAADVNKDQRPAFRRCAELVAACVVGKGSESPQQFVAVGEPEPTLLHLKITLTHAGDGCSIGLAAALRRALQTISHLFA